MTPQEIPEEITQSPEQPRQRHRLTAAAAVAAVLLAAGGGAYWASGTSGGTSGDGPGAGGESGPPPVLALDGVGQEEAGDGRGPGVAPGEPDPNGTPAYRASVPLPKGPRAASVHRPGKVTEERLARIAEALGIDGKPRRNGGGWQVGGSGDGSGPRLTVDGRGMHTWSLTRHVPSGDDKCGASKPGSKGRITACPAHPGDTASSAGDAAGTDSTTGDPVSEAEARQAVRPALKALGLAGAELDASSANGAQRMVSVRPRVGGLPAHDWTGSFTVGPDGTPVRGHGRLGITTEGAQYPVMTAGETLKALNKHRSAPGQVPPCDTPARGGPGPETSPGDAPVGKPGSRAGDRPSSDVVRCSSPRGTDRPAKVTGATFGLLTQYSGGKPVLVPGWIYEVARQGTGEPFRVPFPAVEPEFVKSSAGSGDGPDGRPSEPADRPSGPVGDPTGQPGDDRQDIRSYSTAGKTLTVTFWGGVCHDYRARATETGKRVTVAVTPVKKASEEVCVQIAKQQTAQVELTEPVGERTVMDARGGALPRR